VVSADREATASGLPATFELVTWNTHKGRHCDFEAELARIADDADILLLQEALGPLSGPFGGLLGGPVGSNRIAARMVVTFQRRGTPTGVVTASTVSPSEALAQWSPSREPIAGTPKSALATRYPVAGGSSLLVVNLHAINFRPAAALRAQLDPIATLVAEHPGPLVVAGDFNTWSRARRTAVAEFARRLGLTPVFTGRGAPRLDGVLVRGLEVVSARVLPTHASDHDALAVELAVP
jgi:endonuclease/exonuclease/phosphatase (EEP) superfamily protein YafD